MRRGENPSVVLAALRERVAELNGGALPQGRARSTPFYDRTDLVDTTLKTVFHNLAEGALLVVVVLFVVPAQPARVADRRARHPALARRVVHLPARARHVREPAVDGRGRLRHHRRRRGDPGRAPVPPRRDAARPPRDAERARILHAAREVARPTLFSLLIIIAAYLPIFSLQRVEGRIFAPMAHTVVSALVGALLVSFTLVPVLVLLRAAQATKPLRESPLLRWSRRAYDPTLARRDGQPRSRSWCSPSARSPRRWSLLPRLGSEFLPELNEGVALRHVHAARQRLAHRRAQADARDPGAL